MKRAVPVLILLLLIGGGLVWWLLGGYQPVEIQRADFEGGPTAQQVDAPLSGVPARPTVEETPAKTDTETPPAKVQLSPETAEADWDESAIVPLYGDAVLRGGARATFTLLDAKDQRLWNPSVSVTLYRHVGSYIVNEVVTWDVMTSQINCHGLSGAGLEPGTYALTVHASPYGAFKHEFNLTKGEQLVATLRTPHWRRVVCFEFTDQFGQPVLWIDRYPSVTTVAVTLDEHPQTSRPDRVLRDPPPTSGSGGRGGAGGFAYRRARGSGGVRRSVVATDEGRYYVPVYAGAQNDVTFTFYDAIWGVPEFSVSDTFEERDTVQVPLQLSSDFEAMIADHTKLGAWDPGARSELDWQQQALKLLPSDTPFDSYVHRVVIQLDGPATAVPHGMAFNTKEEMGGGISAPLRFRGGEWYLNLRADEVAWVSVHDQGQVVHEAIRVEFGNEDPKVKILKLTVPFTPVRTPRFQLSPTLDSWAVHRALTATPEDDAEWRFDLDRPEYAVYPAMDETFEVASASLKWEIAAAAVSKSRIEWLHVGGSSSTGPAVMSDVRYGRLTPPTPASGLVLRVIGNGGEGLPWVEGSLVDLEHDRRARRLRGVETHLAAEGKRPELDFLFGSRLHEDPDAYGEATIEPAVMEQYLGEEFLKQSDDRGDLAWYARNNAWYDTHRKFKSDEHGYIVNMGMRLVPGRKYVLYLWSDSRDDLQPDARIVFEATAGVTDIGAINLPSYR
jgi:hypothetical protein